MRILFFSNNFPSPWLPTRATFNFELMRSLARQHDVQVVAPVPWIDELTSSSQVSLDVARDRTETRDGMTIHYPRYVYPPKVARRWYDRFLWRSVKSTLTKLHDFRPDAVLGYWAFPDGAVAVRYARRIGAAAFVIAGGSGVLINAREKGWRREKTARVFRAADGVFAVSADLKQKTIELGVPEDRVHLTYRGVDRKQFSPGDKGIARERLGVSRDLPLLLFVGRLVPVKGLEVLLEAAAVLARTGRPFQLVLAGEGSERSRLESMASALGLARSVRFVGRVLHSQLPDWYRAADWTVLSSHSEGVPNVLLESHACGVPFIATRVGGIPEICIKGVDRLIARGDSAGLAQQMDEALQSPPADPQTLVAHVSGLDVAADRMAEIIQQEVDSLPGTPVLARACPVPDGRTMPTGSCGAVETSNATIQPSVGRVPRIDRTISRPNPFRQFVRSTLAATLPRGLLLTGGPPESGQVCLTFDDGPHPEHTPRLLDALGEVGGRATFFVVGHRAARHPEIVRRIVDEGHALGGHSWSHRQTDRLVSEIYAAEIKRTNEVLADITGHPVQMFRPPMGKLTGRQLLILWRLGQTIVLWNHDSKDYARQSSEDLAAFFERTPARSGDIVLMHDNHRYAAEVLPQLATDIRNRGFSLTTPDEWIAGRSRPAATTAS